MTPRLVTAEALAAALARQDVWPDSFSPLGYYDPAWVRRFSDNLLAAIPPTCANCGAVAHPETPHYFDKPAPDPRLDALLAAVETALATALHETFDPTCSGEPPFDSSQRLAAEVIRMPVVRDALAAFDN